jgi:hypothetical protein
MIFLSFLLFGTALLFLGELPHEENINRKINKFNKIKFLSSKIVQNQGDCPKKKHFSILLYNNLLILKYFQNGSFIAKKVAFTVHLFSKTQGNAL